MSYDKLKSAYYAMRTRCKNPHSKAFKNYGGRGIQCLWPTYQAFRADMEASFKRHVKQHGSRKTTLDRIDNDGDYCKSNCRWATPAQQNVNTRSVTSITYNGQTYCASEWSRITGIKRVTINQRIRNGWPIERALSVSPTIYKLRHKAEAV